MFSRSISICDSFAAASRLQKKIPDPLLLKSSDLQNISFLQSTLRHLSRFKGPTHVKILSSIYSFVYFLLIGAGRSRVACDADCDTYDSDTWMFEGTFNSDTNKNIYKCSHVFVAKICVALPNAALVLQFCVHIFV